ncbi:MAG: coenzyme biosynthesis protein PqqF [Pseudomonas sp.]|nr:coenzyme biosynthesis protein PqqF [Pseudomonas sp.]
MPVQTKHLTLPNGLHVVLHHAPRLKRCAALLRVAAGSHDVPAIWPGLAHFLEHLLFLGTEQFPADDNLMTFVQRHGGQVNASTRERTTEFFFELTQPVFAQGLERLCDMLAHPRMSLPDQLREREVLHAEFIAWSQDHEARYQLELLQPICALHPLRAFHVGNRYSLAVPRQDFQQALRDFYQRFYQAGQMTLTLAGPQSLAELTILATTYGGYFPPGRKINQVPPPPLLTTQNAPNQFTDPHRLHLIFACEELPEFSAEAVQFLCTWLTNGSPGGLLSDLRKRGLIHALKSESLYQFGGQLLLNIEFALSADGAEQRNRITAEFFDWLAYFKSRWPTLREEYSLLQQRHLSISGALELTRHCADDTRAVPALLEQLTPANVLHAQAVDNVSIESVAWKLPEPNPFLSSHDNSDEGAIFLRWRLDAAYPALWQRLDHHLKNLVQLALQAGVNLTFSAYGLFWQLTLTGLSVPMPSILEHAFRLLTAPANQDLTGTEPAQIPIRHLLKRLPDYFLDAPIADDNLSTAWSTARWTFYSAQPLHIEIPGTPDDQPLTAPNLKPGKHWRTELSDGSENAVLLFCPTPSDSLGDEAAWRLLAHIGQAPFYQRLRVELQLGYAVFSSFRQISGRSGWLLGVQSPSATTADIVGHLEAFISDLPTLIETTDLPAQRLALAAQFAPDAMDPRQISEWLWQAHLAGHDAGYPQQLRDALLQFKQASLLNAVKQLEQTTGGWLILTNGRPAR